MTLDETFAFADQRVHLHRRDFVFPDGVKLGNVLDAIAAVGAVENYPLANQLQIKYALDVCVRCAAPRANRRPLIEYGITTSWGSICNICELEFLAMGRRRRAP
jgi:hypothetical protein